MKAEYLLYGSAIVVFGAVVLWATDAPGAAVALAFVLAVGLLAAAALLVRPSPTVLLVGGREGEDLGALEDALRREGFDVETCPGPENSACPATVGKPCPAHGGPIAAVVVRHPDEAIGLAPCGEALRIPELAVEEGSDREPEFAGRYARIGIERGPEAATQTLDRLLAEVPSEVG